MNIESASSSANTDIMEQNRPLKRNINSILCTNQNNVDTNCIKSPARKEIKIDYTDQINREILQWKRLIEKQHTFNKDRLTSQSSENVFNRILKKEQKFYIESRVDCEKLLQNAHEFRRKYLLYVHLMQSNLEESINNANHAADVMDSTMKQLYTKHMTYNQIIPKNSSISP